MPFAKLFRSRWAALIWAGGILWTAVDIAGYAPARSAHKEAKATEPTDATGEIVQNGDLAILANVMGAN
jgi:hypothetical protein